jgi:formate C-acetyltransferase
MLTDRVLQLKARALRTRITGDAKAGPIWQESLAQTEGEPQVLRDAKALAHYYRHQDVTIRPGELIVGAPPGLVTDEDVITPAVFGRRTWEPPEGYWPVPEETHAFWRAGMLSPAGNHTTLDYETVFAVGFRGLIERIEERVRRLLPDETEARHFLDALRLIAEGFIDLSNRYADEAERLAAIEPEAARAAELRTIAANCRRVPAQPPRTFWEACQCAWFSFFFLPDAPGRVDQYLCPAYHAEVEAGTFDRDLAKELLCCLWVKYFESVGATSGVSAHNHLTLGGMRPDGADGSSEVTTLCLEVVEELELLRPQVGVRWHRDLPDDVLRQAVRALRSGTGSPDFCSDEQIVPALVNVGVAVEDARDFSLSGCHEVIVTGKAQMGSVEGFVNMPKILLMALGLEPDLQSGVDLAGIRTFEDLWQRLEASMDLVAEAAHLSAVGRDQAAAEAPGGNLAASLVVQDCIERCQGYTQGGARYNFCNWDIIGTANLVDSLVALRRLVFEEREVTLPEFARVLADDWEGHELLRQRIRSEFPHFGNEEPETDALLGRCIERFDAILKRRTPYRGGVYILGTTAGGENMHIEFGRITGATPDGRRAGEPVADSIGAAQGRDRSGVTGLLNSVASLPHRLLPTATTLNVKLDPQLLDRESGVEAVAALIRSHFLAGGQQLQLTFVNREMLLDAKARPDLYRNLMVRVAGYSAPFTSLWEDMQDEIIARTEHLPA